MATAVTARDAGAADMGDEIFLHEPADNGHGKRGAGDAGKSAGDGRKAKQRCQRRSGKQRRIHAQRQELALGKVDDADNAENHAEAGAEQAIDAADQYAGNQPLQQAFDEDGAHARWSAGGWTETRLATQRERDATTFPGFGPAFFEACP